MSEPTWCEVHRWPVTGWPGTRGRRCALSQGDCVTVVKPGIRFRWSYEDQTYVDIAE